MTPDEKRIRNAIAESLIECWHADAKVGRLLWEIRKRLDMPRADSLAEEIEFSDGIAKRLGATRLHWPERVQVILPRTMRIVNEALWAGRKRDLCVQLARKALGLKHMGRTFTIDRLRERDKTHDWKTVK